MIASIVSKNHVEGIRNCPAYAQECLKCKRKNHFATSKICKGKRKDKISMNVFLLEGRQFVRFTQI